MTFQTIITMVIILVCIQTTLLVALTAMFAWLILEARADNKTPQWHLSSMKRHPADGPWA